MIAILRREIGAYFNSALAWIMIAAYLLVTGMVFVSLVGRYSDQTQAAFGSPYGAQGLNAASMVVMPLFAWMGYLLLFILPVLTMRLIAEESRSGTLEMLFTYPITEWDIVMGKFFGGLTVVLAMMGFSFAQFVALGQLVELEWRVVASGFLGIFLLGCCFVSFGLWASSLTSSQMISAAITYCGLLTSWLVVIADRNVQSLKEVFGELSVMSHLEMMARGTISTHHLVYYLAWTCLFLFLTVRVLESRKWSA